VKTIREYYIDKKCLTPTTIYLPRDAEVVNISELKDQLVLFVLLDLNNQFTTNLRTFKICRSGENIYSDAVKYIGSINTDIGIRHVVEIIRGV
jgi:hypothetical protein